MNDITHLAALCPDSEIEARLSGFHFDLFAELKRRGICPEDYDPNKMDIYESALRIHLRYQWAQEMTEFYSKRTGEDNPALKLLQEGRP